MMLTWLAMDSVFTKIDLIEKLFRENKLCYIMGDFNLNLLNHCDHLATGEFMDGLYSLACVQTAPPLKKKKNRSGTVCDLPLIIVFKDHVAFSGMCGKWFDWLLHVDLYIIKTTSFDSFGFYFYFSTSTPWEPPWEPLRWVRVYFAHGQKYE